MWWKLYFLLMLLTVLGTLSDYVPTSLPNFIALILMVLSLLSLYSYIFKKPFLSPDFWRKFFWVSVVLTILSILAETTSIGKNSVYLLFFHPPTTYDSFGYLVAVYLLIFIIALPGYWALYKLGQGAVKKETSAKKSTSKTSKKKSR